MTHRQEGKKLKLVFVEWMDHSSSTQRWSKFSELEERCEPLLLVSVGWLLKQNKECIVLVPHKHSDEMTDWTPYGSGDMTIIRSSIKKIIELKEPKL